MCNITFFGSVDVSSEYTCGYLNYHVFMVITFGLASIFCTMRACLQYACYTPSEAERSALFAFVFLILCTGFEGVYVLFLLFFFCICLRSPALAVAHALRQAASHIYKSIQTTAACVCAALKMSARVEPVVPIVDLPDCPSTPRCEMIVLHIDTQCPICLESGHQSQWFFAVCGHAFHTECIKKWPGTCPMCRGPLKKNKRENE